eukprot:1838874-Pleurochrysis_carterae.AAC.1
MSQLAVVARSLQWIKGEGAARERMSCRSQSTPMLFLLDARCEPREVVVSDPLHAVRVLQGADAAARQRIRETLEQRVRERLLLDEIMCDEW